MWNCSSQCMVNEETFTVSFTAIEKWMTIKINITWNFVDSRCEIVKPRTNDPITVKIRTYISPFHEIFSFIFFMKTRTSSIFLCLWRSSTWSRVYCTVARVPFVFWCLRRISERCRWRRHGWRHWTDRRHHDRRRVDWCRRVQRVHWYSWSELWGMKNWILLIFWKKRLNV